jgi:hypothetical protein
MPYALPEKQKEFKKLWYQNNKNRIKSKVTEARALTKQTITWEELTKVAVVDKLATWKECVGEAKSAISVRRCNRILIAKLALRACTIRRGGDYRSPKFKDGDYGKTLKEFCESVGINNKTLGDWITVTTAVFDRLPSDYRGPFDYTAAKLAVANSRESHPDFILQRYYAFADKKSNHSRKMHYIVKHLRNLEAALATHENLLTSLSDTDKARCLIAAKSIIQMVRK